MYSFFIYVLCMCAVVSPVWGVSLDETILCGVAHGLLGNSVKLELQCTPAQEP